MLKFLSILTAVCFCSFAYAQTDTLSYTKEEMRLLDSMFKNDEFIKLMREGKNKSYFDLSIAVGNQSLSTTNNNSNAGQLKSSFVLIPGISYNHKSGFGLSVNAFLASDQTQFKPYQYAISPYFEYQFKSFDIAVSYTRYIFNTNAAFSPNPFQNNFYGNFQFTKTQIEPGIAVSYSNGEYNDTVRISGMLRNLNIKISDFSLSPYILHNFYFYKLISKNDALNLTPALLLVVGRQQVEVPGFNRTRLSDYPRLREYLKNRFESDSKFQLQSIAGSVNVRYLYKGFYINPSLYIDYYLPETTYEKITAVFSFSAGVTF